MTHVSKMNKTKHYQNFDRTRYDGPYGKIFKCNLLEFNRNVWVKKVFDMDASFLICKIYKKFTF